MTTTWGHLPAAARPIAVATEAAVKAVRDEEPEALDEAVASLGSSDPAQVGLILGTAVRLLLEERHPDGLTGDDVRAVLERCVRSGMAWAPDIDPHVVLLLLAGALGVHDDSDEPPPRPDVLARHAALVLTDQLRGGRVRDLLDRALHEIERSQLND